MSVRDLLLPVCAVAILLVGVTPSAISAQTADDLFDPRTLEDVRLFVNARDLAELREHWQEDTYYPADLVWRGMRVRNVGIRSRGSGSRNPVKLGLRVDFNRYVTDQQFLGLEALVLDNFWQDPSMIRERTAMALFARMGQPAPREAFCRLYVNDAYQGVYALAEPLDQAFLARTLGEDSGYLFEYQWQRNYYGEYLGDDLEPYAELFEAETHENQAPSTLYGPIRDLVREANGDDEAIWEDHVGPYLDLQAFVTQVAIETFIADIDGLLGNWGMNNFYLYRAADTNRHRLFPWDKDIAFERSDYPILLRVNENAIFRRAFAQSDLRALFLDVLEQCARSAMQDDWLATEMDAAASLIGDAVREDPLKPTSNEEHDASIELLRDFARRRPAFVLHEVAAARRQ